MMRLQGQFLALSQKKSIVKQLIVVLMFNVGMESHIAGFTYHGDNLHAV